MELLLLLFLNEYVLYAQNIETLIEQSLSLIEQLEKSKYSNKTVGSLILRALVAWFFVWLKSI